MHGFLSMGCHDNRHGAPWVQARRLLCTCAFHGKVVLGMAEWHGAWHGRVVLTIPFKVLLAGKSACSSKCFTYFLAMSERQSKLRRLEELRRNNPHISASALSEVILDIEKHGLPELHAKKHVQEARDSTVSEHTAYGPLLETTSVTCKDGTTKQILYVILSI